MTHLQGGKQGPGTLIGNQVFYPHSSEETGFRLWDGLGQNESDITEAIKEAKALCALTIREVEACWVVLISEAKIQHTTCIKEAEADCACTLAEAENHWSIQQSYAKDIQHLEAEAIKEEKECLTFLTACGTILRASPQMACGIHGYPLPPATRK